MRYPDIALRLKRRIVGTVDMPATAIQPYGIFRKPYDYHYRPRDEWKPQRDFIALIDIGEGWIEGSDPRYVNALLELLDVFNAILYRNTYKGSRTWLVVEIDAQTVEEAEYLARRFLERYYKIVPL